MLQRNVGICAMRLDDDATREAPGFQNILLIDRTNAHTSLARKLERRTRDAFDFRLSIDQGIDRRDDAVFRRRFLGFSKVQTRRRLAYDEKIETDDECKLEA